MDREEASSIVHTVLIRPPHIRYADVYRRAWALVVEHQLEGLLADDAHGWAVRIWGPALMDGCTEEVLEWALELGRREIALQAAAAGSPSAVKKICQYDNLEALQVALASFVPSYLIVRYARTADQLRLMYACYPVARQGTALYLKVPPTPQLLRFTRANHPTVAAAILRAVPSLALAFLNSQSDTLTKHALAKHHFGSMSGLYLLKTGDVYKTSTMAEVGYEVVAMAPSRMDDAQREAVAAFFQDCLRPPVLVEMTALDVRYRPLELEYGLSMWPPEHRLVSTNALRNELKPQMQAHRDRYRSRRLPFSRQQTVTLRECAERAIGRYLGLLTEGDPLMRVMMAIEHLEAVPSHPMGSSRPLLNEVDLLVSLRLDPVLERYQIGSRVYEGAAFQELIRPYTLAAQFGCPYASAVRALKWLVNAARGTNLNKKRLSLLGGDALVPLMNELAPGSGYATIAVEGHRIVTVAWTAPPRWLEPHLRG